jgi:hypothetical protein
MLPNKLVQQITLLAYIREAIVSNLGKCTKSTASEFSLFLCSASRHIAEDCLKLGHDRFLSHFFPLIISHPITHRYTYVHFTDIY